MRAAMIAPTMAAISRPPSAAQDFKRIALAGEPCDRRADGVRLAGEPGIVHARAAPHPRLRLAAIERMEDRGGDGGVADPHLAETEKIDAPGDRLHAEGDGPRAVRLVEGIRFGDIRRRHLERQLVDLQAQPETLAELVDGRAAGAEIRHHLRGDALGKGGDAAGDDPVVGSEDGDERIPHRRVGAALPSGQPFDEGLEPAEAPGRLRQRRVARADCPDRGRVRRRELSYQVADVVERAAGRRCWHILSLGILGAGQPVYKGHMSRATRIAIRPAVP